MRITLLILALIVLAACGAEESAKPGRPYPSEPFPISNEIVTRLDSAVTDIDGQPDRIRHAYFGDLHVHTALSLDAFAFGTIATPRDAYRYALGEAIPHPSGFDLQLREPLDFYAVTDHALFLGLAREASDTTTALSRLEVAEPMHNLNDAGYDTGVLAVLKRQRLFRSWMGELLSGWLDGSLDHELATSVVRTAWMETVQAADDFYEPGKFTTFAAFEYTSGHPTGGSLHRNVIFRGSARVPVEPFSRYNSRNPERLWDWMDSLRGRGVEALAIPHNSNLSNGQMFTLVDWAGDPLDDGYADRRLRNEPLVEITQVKGTSETHPALSDTDEWASFEINSAGAISRSEGNPHGSYVRQALLDGIALQENGIANPYKLGFIGSSDTHVAATTDDESNYFSKAGLLDGTPQVRGSVPIPWWQALLSSVVRPQLTAEVEGRNYSQAASRNFGASGLAAVWAEENTREAIYAAFRRKETFATSGPRIRLRFFAGRGLDVSMLDRNGPHAAYAKGVAMGGDISAVGDGQLEFLAQAWRDPRSAPLQRLQIVKGWTAGEATFERVYDVACSDGQVPDPQTHRCPDNGASVDLKTCTGSSDTGSGELRAEWQDPDFDPSQLAFYYARVIENPSCRWSTWDAVRLGVAPRPDLPATIQERAWSSPVWVTP